MSEIRGARLHVSNLQKSYRGVRAVAGLSFTVEPGEILGLIGPNGSGKTTVIDCITGFTRADRIKVELDGQEISRTRSHRLASQGLVRTFQQVRVFGTLSVRDNVLMGGLGHARGRRRSSQRESPEMFADQLIDEFGIRGVAHLRADTISYGQRKLMEIAAALVCRPRILLLDEPVAAINPTLATGIRDRIVDLNSKGLSILLVEHNMELVTGICDRVVVLDHGEKIAEGLPNDVMNDDRVQEAYFGR